MPKKSTARKIPSKRKSLPSKVPLRRYLYEDENMQNAIKAAKDGMSIRSAAIKYNIPRTTLSDKLSGRSPLCRKIGRGTVLSPEEEELVVDWILKSKHRGVLPTRDDILDSIQNMINASEGRSTPFINNRPGRKWLQLFMNRHPVLDAKNADQQPKLKAKKSEDTIRTWFKLMKDQLEEMEVLDIFEDPTRVFCLDEFNIQLCPKTGKAMGLKNWRNVHEMAPGPDKSTMSFLISYRADGETPCPAIIYPYLRVPSDIVSSVPKGFYVGCSESGWVRPENLHEYFNHGLIPWLQDHNVKKPVIIFANGHTTHVTLQLSEFCEQNEIILYLLPPNTGDMLHPGHIGVIESMKILWKEAVYVYQTENPNSIVRRVDVAEVLKFLLEMIDRVSIINGFIFSGLCPLDPDKVDYTKCESKLNMESEKNMDSANPINSFMPYNSNYQIARTVMMELVPKSKLSLAMKNKGDKGLADLWAKINKKIESEIKSEVETPQVFSSVISNPVDEGTEEVVVSIDAESITSATDDTTSDAQYTYVIWDG